MKQHTKTIDKKQIPTETQMVPATPIDYSIAGEMKKFSTEPNLDTHSVAPKASANSLPLK